MAPGTELATLGGGCFWCTDTVFRRLRGVRSVVSGYSGGEMPDPTYQQVCSGTTGHAEVVRIEFDPGEIGYREILRVFFAVHDPTTLNRQGADVGTQYRSVIFHHSPEQERVAGEVVSELEAAGVWPDPIITAIEPAPAFYPAEPEHQDYYAGHSRQPYCQVVISPKLAKLRREFADRLAE